MGIELPRELVAVAAAAGVRWPEADEDAMRAQARAWRDAGTALGALSGDADRAARSTLTTIDGSTADAASRYWSRFVAADGHLPSSAKGCLDAANRLDHAAEQVGKAKVEIVRGLVELAKNKDAATQAAAAGHPTALLGLREAVRGTSVNLANLRDVLVGAVANPGADVGTTKNLVDANPGGRDLAGGRIGTGVTAAPGGLLGVVAGLVPSQAGGGLIGAVTGVVDRGVGAVGSIALGSGGAQSGGLLGGVVDKTLGTVETVIGGPKGGGLLGGVVETAVGVVDTVVAAPKAVLDGVVAPVLGAVEPVVAGPPGGVVPPVDPVAGAVDTPVDTPVAEPAVPAPHSEPVIDLSGSEGTGPIAVPSADRLADLPTPQAGIPMPDNAVHAASAAVLDAPAAPSTQQPSPQTPPQPPPPPPTGAGQPPVQAAPPSGPGAAAAAVAARPAAIPAQGPGAAPNAQAQPNQGRQQAQSGQQAPGNQARAGGPAGGPGPSGPAPGGQESLREPLTDQAVPLDPGRLSGVGPISTDAPIPFIPAPVDRAHHDTPSALFVVHMFPLGHLPVAASLPTRQLAPPSAELDYAAGLRFPPGDHPSDALVDGRTRAQLGQQPPPADPGHLTDGHDQHGGRDWDRRYLVRPADINADVRVEYAWPPGELFPEGGVDAGVPEILPAGVELDRFGIGEGRVLAADATPYAERSLPPSHLGAEYRRYRVKRALPVWRAQSAPWFGQPGGGVRYRTTHAVTDLVALGYLTEITLEATG